MNREQFETILNDYVDGLLPEKEKREVERHLERDPEARDRLAEVRFLKQAARELPREVAPEHDLWPGIRMRIRPERAAGDPARAGRPRPSIWAPWLPVAAALMIGLALAVALGLFRNGRGSDDIAQIPVSLGPTNAELTRAGLQSAEEEYRKATEQLVAALDQRRDQLSPETLKVLDENLRIINGAIEEVRQALEADPQDDLSRHTLTAMYRQRVQLLWKASRLSPEI